MAPTKAPAWMTETILDSRFAIASSDWSMSPYVLHEFVHELPV